jgi:hypothetical protein
MVSLFQAVPKGGSPVMVVAYSVTGMMLPGDKSYFQVSGLLYLLVMTNIAMEAMAHRNRWFT